MSLYKSRRKLLLARSILHPLISITLPFFFIATATCILNSIYKNIFPSSSVFFIVLLLTGAEESFMGNILFKEKVPYTSRIREFIFILIITFLVLLFNSSENINTKPIDLLTISNIFIFSSVALQWILTFIIHKHLRNREILLYIMAKNPKKNIKDIIRNNSVTAYYSIFNQKKIKKYIISFQIIILIMLSVLFILEIKAGPLLPFFAISQSALGLIFLIIINNQIEDQLLLPEGITNKSASDYKRLYYIFFVLICIFLFVILTHNNKSIFSLSYIEDFFKWLINFLFPKREIAITEFIKQKESYDNFKKFLEMHHHNMSGPNNFIKILLILLTVIEIMIIAGLGIYLLYLLISPVLSKSFRKKAVKIKFKPLNFISYRVLVLLRFFKKIWQEFLNWFKKSPESKPKNKKRKAKAKINNIKIFSKKEKNSFFKKIEINRVLNAFLKLTRWGGKQGLPYQMHIAPLEYGENLAKAISSKKDILIEAMQILEEVLFSGRILTQKRIQYYLKLIKQIIKS